MSIYRCLFHNHILEVAKFQVVRNKAHDKRFPIYSNPYLCPYLPKIQIFMDSIRVNIEHIVSRLSG